MTSNRKTFSSRVAALQRATQALVASFYGEHEDHLPTNACRACGCTPGSRHAAPCLVGPVEDALRQLAAADLERRSTRTLKQLARGAAEAIDRATRDADKTTSIMDLQAYRQEAAQAQGDLAAIARVLARRLARPRRGHFGRFGPKHGHVRGPMWWTPTASGPIPASQEKDGDMTAPRIFGVGARADASSPWHVTTRTCSDSHRCDTGA